MSPFILSILFIAIQAAFIPASSPSIWTVGRTLVEQDGSLSFDWENTQFYINIQGGTYLKIHMKASGSAVGRFLTWLNRWEGSSFWVDSTTEEIMIASRMDNVPTQVRIISGFFSFFFAPFLVLSFTFSSLVLSFSALLFSICSSIFSFSLFSLFFFTFLLSSIPQRFQFVYFILIFFFPSS